MCSFRSYPHPNEKIFYVVVFRVTLGKWMATDPILLPDGKIDTAGLKSKEDAAQNVFPESAKNRDLPPIKGIKPSVRHHALIAEKVVPVAPHI